MIALPYLLRKEHICHISDGLIHIGDRRAFPFEKRFEACSTVEEVATAIKAMVTQGGGPLQVAFTTLRFITTEMQQERIPYSFYELQRLVALLVEARPTNTTMKRVMLALLEELSPFCTPETPVEEFVNRVNALVDKQERRYDELYHSMGKIGSTLIEDGDVILTTCFAEHTFLLSLAYAKEQGKHISVLVNETRPYLQGSRLTYPSLLEMGIEAHLITDGMGAHYLSEGKVTKYMTASDLVCMDGTVVNKVGTLGNAVACKHYGVPYFAFSISPDPTKQNASDITMEERDGQDVLTCLGQATTVEGRALYPSFDIIEPSLVQGIVTAKGVYTPSSLARSFS
ncbi:MAG TPA: translation initiation factor 2 [Sphaerochaeta sp.]|nr:translation initiation factor 2 [Sphaerochaeta sp.]